MDIWNVLRPDWFLDEDAMGVVEVILIIVVLIALVALFKEQMNSLVKTLLNKVTTKSNAI